MDAEAAGEKPAYKKRKAREIFAVDRRTWAHVCKIGLDAATAYIVLASGTGGDQRTTYWSAQSIEKYAGMRWYLANETIELLRERGLITKHGEGKRPGYRLNKPDEIPGCEQSLPVGPESVPLSSEERAIFGAIEASGPGGVWVPSQRAWGFTAAYPCRVARSLERKGLVRWTTGQTFVAVSKPEANDNDESRDLVWLPNSIVVGVADEVAPIRLLRRTQNLLALRLFVDLYGAHRLRRLAGVEWRYPHGIKQAFDRHRLGARGEFIVWGFDARTYVHSWQDSNLLTPYGAGQSDSEASKQFWDAFRLLCRHGLVEMIPHLVANEVSAQTPEPDLIHPLPINNGEPDERAITEAARAAARAILSQAQWDKAQEIVGDGPIVPVERDFEQVQLIGIPRMRYRPQTEATAKWHATWAQERAERVGWFKDMEAAALGEQPSRAANVRH